MAGPGRFAIGSSFGAVQRFFEKDPDTGDFINPLAPGIYTAAQIGGGTRLTLTQSRLDDGAGDLAERTYVWNVTAFKIDDGARFGCGRADRSSVS
jgi:hypothetical protein